MSNSSEDNSTTDPEEVNSEAMDIEEEEHVILTQLYACIAVKFC